MARKLHHTIEGADIQAYIKDLIEKVTAREEIEILTDAVVLSFDGFQGNFATEVGVGPMREPLVIEHGVILVATGANEYQPTEFLYGQDDRVKTQVELTEALHQGTAGDPDCVAMIQCVGSRNEDNPNCSRICCQSAVNDQHSYC